MLRVKTPHLASWTSARQRNATQYRELIAAAGLTGRVTPPVAVDGRTHIYNQFVVRVADRDRVKAGLDARGIGTAIYYPKPSAPPATRSRSPSSANCRTNSCATWWTASRQSSRERFSTDAIPHSSRLSRCLPRQPFR